jgi:hypothetical protein
MHVDVRRGPHRKSQIVSARDLPTGCQQQCSLVVPTVRAARHLTEPIATSHIENRWLLSILAAARAAKLAKVKAGDLECHASSPSPRPKGASESNGILKGCCSAKFSGARSGPAETS